MSIPMASAFASTTVASRMPDEHFRDDNLRRRGEPAVAVTD